MRINHSTIRLLLFASFVSIFLSVFANAETVWNTRSGQVVEGDLVAFDFTQKIAVIKSETKGEARVPTSDLDYKARKRILFSPAFHKSYPKNWSTGQSSLLIYAVFGPAILFLIGMWIAGMVFAKRWSPFKAFFGFFGSWIVGVLLMVCYFKFAADSGEGGMTVLIVGAFVATLASSTFISVIYRCKMLEGFYIFISQFFFGILVAIGLVFWAEKKVDPIVLDEKSEDYVFDPVGIVGEVIELDENGEPVEN